MKLSILFNKNAHFVSAGSDFVHETKFKTIPTQLNTNVKTEDYENYI